MMTKLIFLAFPLLTLSASCEESISVTEPKQAQDTATQLLQNDTSDKTIRNLPDPLAISAVDKNPDLDYTSGGSPANGAFCDSTKDGFYGNYHFIDKRLGPVRRGTDGLLVVFKRGRDMSKWTSADRLQEFRQIHLKTNVLSVWDSIQVGLPKKKINEFVLLYQGEYETRTSSHCRVLFKSFTADFNFAADTVSELTITKRCQKP